jgi:hypothetical protein
MITYEKVSKTKGNLEGSIKALMGLNGPEANKMVAGAVSIIAKQTKKIGQPS